MVEGGKALALRKLREAGFMVPPFIACGTEDSDKTIMMKVEEAFPKAQYFAVRSSAEVEDSKERSFAGHFYTGIGIARKKVPTEVAKVRQSFGTMHGSVLIQAFIPSDAAGVMFTEVDKNNVVINATVGLCLPIVSGAACDEYVCSKKGRLLSKNLSKEKDVTLFVNGSIVPRKSSEESLDESKIKLLIQLAAEIQSFFGSPQDVEWCFENDRLYVLQSRPITRDFTIGNEEYFDSANIAESYSGVVLPLTCSFAKMVYERVYKDLLRMSGVSRKKIEHHSYVFENLLGFFYGRMYYNMNNWYRMAEFLPGYRRNKENFELMITSNIKKNVATSIKPSRMLSMLYPFIVGAKVAFFGITSHRFTSNVRKHLRSLRNHDFDRLTYEECISLFQNLNENLLRRWYVTLENDFLVMTYLGILKKLLGEKDLQKALLFRSKATEQVAVLASLSKQIGANRQLWQSVESDDEEAFNNALARDPKAKDALEDYLHSFGGRFANELKLESVGVDEDRKKLFAVLRAYRNYTPRSRGDGAVLPEKMIARLILRKFKKYASRREEFRLLRSNTFAMARRLFRRMGKLLTDKGAIEHIDDVFYLSVDEILTSVAETSKTLSKIVERRKQEYSLFKNIAPPSHFSTFHNQLPKIESTGSKASITQARPASPGVVRGKVKVFKDFSMPDEIDFDILVTSHTDPGWTSLIALSRGLIIEHGGVLSHASIVARELGIPAVIGAENAVGTLRDYQVVEIDGSTGTIRIL
ncbi:MAG: Pyruvate phosphate dikinase PEP/pyruvate-binding protein [Parcubacteria group bacterium GW2011_GWA2_47_7]|nr:MAG: Pyruvate phosphate dikinase PEP/pyruvate-binding protein [Parcubacteria group bacterium GW2011_GWA2_47_7]